MIAHASAISGIATHGGSRIATAGYDNRVILWDRDTATALSRGWHDHLANQCQFSPDGRFLVSASSDYTARVWSVPELRLLAVLGPHDDDVEMAAVSPDSTRVATASRDHAVRIFTPDGRLLRVMRGHAADVISVGWVDDRFLVSSGDDGTVRRWDGQTGQELERIALRGAETDTFAIGPDGEIYAGNDEGMIITIRDGVADEVQAHQAGIKRLVMDSSGLRLLSTSYDRTVRLWHIEPHGLVMKHEASVPADVWIRSCAFVDADTLVFGTFGTSYATYALSKQQWDLANVGEAPGSNAVAVVDGHVYSVGDSGVVRRDGLPVSSVGSLCNFLCEWRGTVVAGGQTGEVFDALTGEVFYQHWSPLNCAAPFPLDGEVGLAVGTYTGEAALLAMSRDGAVRHVGNVKVHDNAIKGIACSGDRLFTVSATGAAAFLSANGAVTVDKELPDAHDKISNGCDALPDGRFVSVSRDRKLRIWDGPDVEVIDTPHTHSVKCVRVAPDGTSVATGAFDGCVWIYHLAGGEWTGVRPTTSGISALAADERGFLASSYDGTVYEVPYP